MPYVVRCPDYTSKPLRTRADAERYRDRVVEFNQCRHEHTIEEIPKKSGRNA